MPTETEIKILDINPSKIKSILRKNKAKFVKKVFQRNIFYSNTSTEKRGVTVRIRQENTDFWLTVKSPIKLINNHKVRKEYEDKISDYKFGNEMLNLLGLKQKGIGEAKREYFKLNNCSVEIIIIPKIPPYLEIEGSEKDIIKVAKKLGYSEKDYFSGNILGNYKVKDKFLSF